MNRILLPVEAMLVALAATPAQAYIGPGPGFGMRGEFMILMGVLLLCLCLMLAVPIRALVRKLRKTKPPTGE